MRRFVAILAFLLLPAAGYGQVKLTQKADRITVDMAGKPFTELIVKGEGVRKPYFYPIYTSSGKIITRHYPMEVVEGESHDHPHHRGLWFAHGDVNGYDFWSSDPSRQGDKYGAIGLNQVLEVVSGDQAGHLLAVFDWKAPDGKVLVTEKRKVTFTYTKDLRVMNFDILLTGVQDAHFGDTKEGTFAIRVADSMNERHGGTLVNAQGARGEKNTWGKRSPWMDYYGEVDGETVGVAFFDHPGNPGHPTYWHVRAYGLFAANIFGEHDFYRDETRDGGRTLKAGSHWRFRYRVVIHPGSAASAGIDANYASYAGGKYLRNYRSTGRCVPAENTTTSGKK